MKCTLSAPLLAKAMEELNEPEDNTERLAAIDKLRESFSKNQKGYQLHCSDDAFILRFLWARKFDHDRALAMLLNYHKQRNSWSEVFEKVNNPTLLTPLLDAGCVFGMPSGGKDGTSLFMGRPGKQKDMIFTDFVAGLFLTVEKMLENEEMQIHGLTVIEDLSYMDLDLAKQMGPASAKRFLNLLQDCLPVRVKCVSLVNEPTVFDVLFKIVQPFMKEKTRKRLRVIGNSYEKLHEVVDPAKLPAAYNGTGPEVDTEGWKRTLLGRGTNI
uniref:Alpha-tocopherol transfer protein-like n=1 Tax=Phallusia mammillata TaxID=59560 RepID=A0A6F9DV95_9ASCI|nr:alpha-tocopherol transfer protein-like [Phallusia mammillata]